MRTRSSVSAPAFPCFVADNTFAGVGKAEWLYKCIFDFAADGKETHALLEFLGLDTLCDVYLVRFRTSLHPSILTCTYPERREDPRCRQHVPDARSASRPTVSQDTKYPSPTLQVRSPARESPGSADGCCPSRIYEPRRSQPCVCPQGPV